MILYCFVFIIKQYDESYEWYLQLFYLIKRRFIKLRSVWCFIMMESSLQSLPTGCHALAKRWLLKGLINQRPSLPMCRMDVFTIFICNSLTQGMIVIINTLCGVFLWATGKMRKKHLHTNGLNIEFRQW